MKDTQIGQLSNNITFVSKAVMRLTKLRQFYMGNSPFVAENICEAWENENSEYAQQYKTEDLKWDNLKDLTDVEVYNCPNLTKLPTFLKALPEMQLINVACNRGISGEQLKDDWQAPRRRTGRRENPDYLHRLQQPENIPGGNIFAEDEKNWACWNVSTTNLKASYRHSARK